MENTTSKNTPFLHKMGFEQLVSMYDLLLDTLLWIKDKEHQFVYANAAFIEHFGCHHLREIIGKTDYDFSPPHLARQFIKDDERIMGGNQVDNRLEMNLNQSGDVAWYSTSKRPIFDEFGNIIGSYGITRHLEKTELTMNSVEAIKTPVKFIQQNYRQPITVEKLANLAFLSISALERRFKKHLTKTPKQYINEVRLENARRLLVETNKPIAEIGYEVGFSDHSYFSKQFKKLFGQQPSETRDEHLRKLRQTPP